MSATSDTRPSKITLTQRLDSDQLEKGLEGNFPSWQLFIMVQRRRGQMLNVCRTKQHLFSSTQNQLSGSKAHDGILSNISLILYLTVNTCSN